MDVLHVFGSTQSDFYFKLSKLYASAVLRPVGVNHRFAAVSVNRTWRFGKDVDDLGPELPLDQAISQIGTPDLVVPHMFCRNGMTAYRALIEDVLELPLVVATASVSGLATSKLWTRDVVASAGVNVARGERVQRGDTPSIDFPFVVKPDSEDNSLGISFVDSEEDAEAAVAHAFEFDDSVFAEEFIPGRELRAAVVDTGDDLICPAFIEYPVSEARPIREVADKLEAEEAGQGKLQQSTRDDAQPICPAHVSKDLAQKLKQAAIKAHGALGARDYSLFDFRVHRDTGKPYLLEAGLCWSFSDLSAITKMLRGANMDADAVTLAIWENAAARKVRPNRVKFAAA